MGSICLLPSSVGWWDVHLSCRCLQAAGGGGAAGRCTPLLTAGPAQWARCTAGANYCPELLAQVPWMENQMDKGGSHPSEADGSHPSGAGGSHSPRAGILHPPGAGRSHPSSGPTRLASRAGLPRGNPGVMLSPSSKRPAVQGGAGSISVPSAPGVRAETWWWR